MRVLLLSPLCEYAGLLCATGCAGEETALDLMSVFAQCPARWTQFRCHLLVALTGVLVCSSCASGRSRASLDFLDLLLQIAQDAGDLHGDGAQRCLRATACDCLREMEASCPGLLSQRLELLAGLRQQESCRLHQAYVGLQVLVLRNAVYQLTQEAGAGAAHLKALLGGNTSGWEAEQEASQPDGGDSAVQSSLVLGPMGRVPSLHTGPDCKELRSVLSSLLEESYLLTPLCQAALFHRLIELVAMVPGIPPSILRAQLLRLLGTNEVCLLHVTLLMKCAFTDSLFSAEDEAFLLKRLVVLSQHPLLSAPDKLFYMDCILHFPENRPIGCGDSDEALPVLLTPQLASALLPTVFNDSATLLARLNLQALVYLEEEEEEGGEGRGLAYIYEHLTALLHIVEGGGSRDIVVTFFRAAYLFLSYFHRVEQYSALLSQQLCRLYLLHPQLAPNILNLVQQTLHSLAGCSWAVGLLRGLQGAITEAPLDQLTLPDLSCHLRVLARVAEEAKISQRSSLGFLSAVVTRSSLRASGDWRLGNGVLGVCRRLLLHPSLDSLLIPLADILLHLACNYGDTDVQDHARLYYALLTTLSWEKLTAVLAQSAAEGGGQVKRPTLSGVMAESEGLVPTLSVHRAETAVFQLSEARPQPQPQPQTGGPPLAQDEGGGALEAYRAQFREAGSAPQITLQYRLTHTEPPHPRFEQLFSIRLHFSLTDQNYEQLQDVSVPCLSTQRPAPVLRLTLTPRQPYPTTIHVSAVFTSSDGLTWHAPVPDIHVSFQHTFLPLPVPPAWSRARREELFQELWEEMCGQASGCAVSLFCCQLGGGALKALLQEHFLPFLLSHPSQEDGFRVLLFLPPRSHLLLKISCEEDAVQFNMATDNWQLLPHINAYLLRITCAQDLPVT
ncbi:AP-5 complex subunit beta-1 isoform X2 [Fundulus heteroclitus]|uniref:AP-5 complex subunit beta-1 isoform X2 n=1 Tax=Fundulus heteroclitus TaxID=8078 RepID=UPI00165C352A|nr:AP-5 complex subunit beta-1 isoform X2 [Fundulus heteroclitus]